MADEEAGVNAPEDSVVVTSAPKPEPEVRAGIEETDSAAETQGVETGVEGDDHAAQEPEEQPKAKHKANPFQSRIDELTKIRRDQERQIAELKAANEARQEQQQEPAAAIPASDFEAIVSRKAAEIVQQRETQGRLNTWLQAGLSEFKEDFNERCNTVASLGAQERPEFMQIVTDPEIIPDGHRVVAALADDPMEAARILSLPPVQMSAALVRYASKLNAPKPKPLSAAPAPIKPLDGTSRGSDEPSANDSEEEWFRKRQAQIAARAQTGARF